MAKPKRKTKRARRRAQPNEYDEEREMAKKLASRYSKKRVVEGARNTPAIDRSSGRIFNPHKHDSALQRALQGHLNKLNAPEEPPKFLARQWVCALCGRQSCSDGMGDLYGPYYMQGTSADFPDYLPVVPRTKASSRSSPVAFDADDPDVFSDLWFHGPCALYSPALLLDGRAIFALGRGDAEDLQRSFQKTELTLTIRPPGRTAGGR
ncbi:hypothetical protein M3Y99_01498100 [Aphelenchoides fujianensis]|nr:hypothetical protein M3Y99_01498100 [Aphelenchoides fujianensis]